ncbi:MAG: uracil-DNA glycosylase, partial [Candidatus Pacebacteria bacterium]|nr:uracil-DNA glycosylase [Candidatus Paceibacterota bacterium]
IQGQPFRGQAGAFLDDVLRGCGMSRNQLFITSSVKCRPPNNRDPKPLELAVCRDRWLTKQIACIKPTLVVLLGRAAAQQSLETNIKLAQTHGNIFEKDGVQYMITYHPAAAMRFPLPADGIRADFEKLRELRHVVSRNSRS